MKQNLDKKAIFYKIKQKKNQNQTVTILAVLRQSVQRVMGHIFAILRKGNTETSQRW